MGATAAFMFAGTALQAYGQYQSGKFTNALMQQNARVAEIQAEDALSRGTEAEQLHRQQVQGLIGSQRASFAGQNVDVGSGSALDIQAETSLLGELDALTIRTNAAREAWGHRVQAEDYRARGRIARAEGTIGAASTLLTGGARTYYMAKS